MNSFKSQASLQTSQKYAHQHSQKCRSHHQIQQQLQQQLIQEQMEKHQEHNFQHIKQQFAGQHFAQMQQQLSQDHLAFAVKHLVALGVDPVTADATVVGQPSVATGK